MYKLSRFAHVYDLEEAVALYHSLRMKPVYLNKETFKNLQDWLASSFCNTEENIPENITNEVYELIKYKIITKTDDEDEKVLNYVRSVSVT